MSDTLQALCDRAEACGLSAQIVEIELEGEPPRQHALFQRDREDDEQPSSLFISEGEAPAVAGSCFDDFRLLPEFEAIWSPTLGIIECGLDAGNPRIPASITLEAIARRLGPELDPSQPYAEAEITLAVPSPRDDLSITLRTCSLEYAIFRPLFGRRVPLRLERPLRLPVMRIEGYYAPSAEDAAEFLERLGNAVLFQLDLKTNVPMFLSRPAPAVTRPAAGRREITPLRPPEFEYDAEPMALYWYGRTAFQMPLLQFLAFYQVVEYYFPSFSEVKVRENIQRILKDPRFDYTNNGHLARLIAQVKPSRSGRGFGDERSQLQAAIQECVSVEDMRAFFEEDDRRKRFYDRSSGKKMPLVPVKVPVGAEGDLRPNAAERLYDIRCRIVHTKSTDESADKILLPFSREAGLLRFDTELMEFIAKQVLIATSRRLRIA